MQWTPDVSAGDWIRERLDPTIGASMHAVVPRGFPAYVRIFHPAMRDRPVGRHWPPVPYDRYAAEWEDFQRARPEIDVERVSWAATAAAFGRRMHPLAQWHRLALRDPSLPIGEDGARDAAGWRYSEPMTGDLEPDLLARIAALLARHTGTPDDCYVAVWEGHGGLVGGSGYGPSRVLLADASTPRHEEFLAHSVRDRFNDVFRKPTWQPGLLSDEISRGARLSLPGRDHVLFGGSIAELADPSWPQQVPWWEPASAASVPDGPSPSLAWPSDQAWVMVTDVDLDSTIVAGSAEVVNAVCADPDLEALPVPEGAELGYDSDGVNR